MGTNHGGVNFGRRASLNNTHRSHTGLKAYEVHMLPPTATPVSRDAALALRSEPRALEDQVPARLDALAKGLMATAEIGGQPSRQAPR